MNTNPFILRPDCLADRQKLKAVLADIFPSEKLKVNLTLAAYDESIVLELDKTTRIDNFFFSKFVRVLMNDYGISEENAQWSIDYWIENYAVEVLGKENNVNVQPVSTATAPTPPIVRKQTPLVTVPAPAEMVELIRYEENDKLPKTLIERIPYEEKKHGITDLKCSAFKDYSADRYTTIKITGQYFGQCSKYTVMYFMIYNANNELIGADFGEKIDSDFKGQKTFERYIQVPKDEYISKIIVRIMPDPVFSEQF